MIVSARGPSLDLIVKIGKQALSGAYFRIWYDKDVNKRRPVVWCIRPFEVGLFDRQLGINVMPGPP